MSKEITIPYIPRKWAKEKLHNNNHRYKILVLARRSGKTVASINHMIKEAILKKGTYAYIAPFYKQSKRVAWDILKKYTNTIPSVKYNEADLSCLLPNGSKIMLLGSDNADALRGIGLHGVILDEYAQHKASVWGEIIRPTLADHQGWAIFLFTPKGRNEAYNLYKQSLLNDEWHSVIMNVYEVGEIIPEEIESLKKSMSDEEFGQEFMVSFDSAVQGAVYGIELDRIRKENRITNVPYDANALVYTAWDLGISDSTAIIFFQIIGKEYHIIDLYENNGQSLDHYIKYVRNKEYIYDTHFAPHDIRARELGTGKTRYEIAQELEIDFEILPAENIMEGINQSRVKLRSTWIDRTNCEKLIDYLGLYHFDWNDERGSFSDKPKHDYTSHLMDAMRYMFMADIISTGEAKITFANSQGKDYDNDDWSKYNGNVSVAWQ